MHKELSLLNQIPTFNVPTVAMLLGIKVVSLYKTLWRHRDRLRPPAYRRDGIHPRKIRMLYTSDVKILSDICTRGKSPFAITKKMGMYRDNANS